MPEEYRAWVESDQNTLGSLLAGRKPGRQLRILEPAPGTLYDLDPDLLADDQRFRMRADGTGPIEWKSSTLEFRSTAGEATVKLREGRHEILARDTATGETVSTWIQVDRW